MEIMSKTRSEYVQGFVDTGYQIPENWTKDALTIVECKRIIKIGLTARYAADVPRRLGVDAVSAELAADKKLSKRIAYAYMSLWTRYVNSSHAPLPRDTCPAELVPPQNWKSMYVMAASQDEIKQAGATIIWKDWWEDLRPKLIARRMVLATFAANNGLGSWGYRMCSGITDEIAWIDEKIASWDEAMSRYLARQ